MIDNQLIDESKPMPDAVIFDLTAKKRQSDQIRQHVADYLSAGGTIKKLDKGDKKGKFKIEWRKLCD